MNKISKFLLAVLIYTALITLSSCTENQRARQFGGTETVELPKGQRLILATWKGGGKESVSLWYLTEPMPADYTPTIKTFHEKSDLGVWQGTVIFKESR